MLGAERDRRVASTRACRELVGALRNEREETARVLNDARDRRQSLEIELAETRIRREAAIETLRHELGATPGEAIGTLPPELADDADPAERRLLLEHELSLLGPVNPLAREELLVLQARNEFLESQLEDVRSARRELNQVIRVIDAEIVDVFAPMRFADVAHHHEQLISSLFPGGSGQLVLTAPDDLLTTGVEIEARPAGRNVRRLSLLSGGERSLVAPVCLFCSRYSDRDPRPFISWMRSKQRSTNQTSFDFSTFVDEFHQ